MISHTQLAIAYHRPALSNPSKNLSFLPPLIAGIAYPITTRSLMADDPPRVQEQPVEPESDSHSYCPFCTITATFRPIAPADIVHKDWDPDRLAPPTYVLLSTKHVVAFLDIAPLTRGHVLVTPRKHRVKVGDLSSDEAAEVSEVPACYWLSDQVAASLRAEQARRWHPIFNSSSTPGEWSRLPTCEILKLHAETTCVCLLKMSRDPAKIMC